MRSENYLKMINLNDPWDVWNVVKKFLNEGIIINKNDVETAAGLVDCSRERTYKILYICGTKH